MEQRSVSGQQGAHENEMNRFKTQEHSSPATNTAVVLGNAAALLKQLETGIKQMR
jgi:hypothetical protein